MQVRAIRLTAGLARKAQDEEQFQENGLYHEIEKLRHEIEQKSFNPPEAFQKLRALNL